MKRARPKQHKRTLKSGKKILINRGIHKKIKRKRFKESQYKYVTGIIKNKRNENVQLSREYDRLWLRKIEPIPLQEKAVLDERLSSIKKNVANNSNQIDRLNKIYFPDNPR